ncbi:DMT family transporter [Marinobacter sp. C2H3]|uniref:DMT family transporter n=1 Tax=Marinobacter sp. C2H3 TaxID=3119003 RepID=UPI00300EC37E
MPIAVHYGLTVLIWGLTWTAIRLQVEAAPVDLSVFYRFVMAAGVALVVLVLTRRLQRLSLRQHGWLVLQGLTLYSVNFLLIYRAAESMTSGLLAVVFSLAALFNAFNGWLWLRARPTPRLYPAVALGVSGVALLFWHDLELGNATGASILFALGGTFWFSMGNLVSVRVRQAGVPLLLANAWAMVYGALILGAWCLFQGVNWVWPSSASFWGATVFLAVPGSIIAFYCYITVIQTLGADRAGYATVLFPVVALSVSTWLEGFEWTAPAVAGAAMAILGNYVLFRRPARVV